jgi:hypothetical protein
MGLNNSFGKTDGYKIVSSSGFAAGTLVHVKGGTKPIEQIRVGDEVLSKSVSDGRQEYKRVLRLFVYKPETIMEAGYVLSEKPNYIYTIVTSLNHMFWVVDDGWTAAKRLPFGPNAFGKRVELADGRYVEVGWSNNIYISNTPNVGWRPSYMGDVCRPGALWDYVNHPLISTEVMALEEIQEFELDDPYLKLPVYNQEVEDFHTYYVGEHGVLVHGDARVVKSKAG